VTQSIAEYCVYALDYLCKGCFCSSLLREIAGRAEEGDVDRLDDTDERILTELVEHARATFAEIGERVNLSAPAVKRRVDRMLDSGVIRGFTTVIDRNALGWTTEAYVQVYCHGTIAPDELRRAWVDIPEVVSAATVTGTSDAILHVLARDMSHLEVALERIRSSADIERSESIVVLSNLIDRARFGG
jgi:DNA-binding Lrp family transcriptional regulator